MCGIVGIISNRNSAELRLAIKKMKKAISHRGPDDDGEFIQDGIALGHQRLSIIETSSSGHQPMFSKGEEIVVVFNGEIYNYIELREVLKTQYSFRTHSDTEVIIAAYLIWGIEFIERLNGMFAIALFDKVNDKFFLIRDRIGEKPLYFSSNEEVFVFSSEIRALLTTEWVRKKISISGLREYAMFQTVAYPNTILEDVFSVKPGTYLEASSSGWKEFRYWDFKDPLPFAGSVDEIKGKVKEELYRSVDWRMRADVSFGAFLSGGLDSTVLVNLMSKISDKPVHTFSIGFEEKQWDESDVAKIVSKRFGTEHTSVVLNGNSFLDELENAINALDHPSGDGVNSYVVSKVTRSYGIKMAMSGLGGDELFGGYPIFERIKNTQRSRRFIPWNWIPTGAAKYLLSKKWNGVQVDRVMHLLMSKEMSNGNVFQSDRLVNGKESLAELFLQYDMHDFDNAQLKWKENGEKFIYASISEAEMKGYMTHILLRDGDQMSMANGLEVRVPFLDHELIELVMNIPDQFKQGVHPKQLLIDIFKNEIPKEVYNRKKQGFSFPWGLWMQRDLKDFCQEGIDSLKQLGVFRNEILDLWWKQFLSGDKNVPWIKIWHLIVLGHWIKRNEIHA